MRLTALLAVALLAALAFASPALAQWPTACVTLNDIVEAHLGNHGNVGIYQRTFDAGAEAACQSDHRDDVRHRLRLGLRRSSRWPHRPHPLARLPASRSTTSSKPTSATPATSRSTSAPSAPAPPPNPPASATIARTSAASSPGRSMSDLRP